MYVFRIQDSSKFSIYANVYKKYFQKPFITREMHLLLPYAGNRFFYKNE